MAIQHISREIPPLLPNGMFFLMSHMGQLRWTRLELVLCFLKTERNLSKATFWVDIWCTHVCIFIVVYNIKMSQKSNFLFSLWQEQVFHIDSKSESGKGRCSFNPQVNTVSVMLSRYLLNPLTSYLPLKKTWINKNQTEIFAKKSVHGTSTVYFFLYNNLVKVDISKKIFFSAIKHSTPTLVFFKCCKLLLAL